MSTEASPSPDVDTDCRRSDARRNHERILAAAVAVFAEKGIDASIPEIAARAGVGKATVYRNYATKDDLIAAIALERLQWMAGRADAAAAEPDAYAALRGFLEDVFSHIKSDRVLTEALAVDRSTETAQLRARIQDVISGILGRGRDEGTVRADVTYEELRVLVAGLAAQLHRDDVTDRDAWRRYAGLIVDVLRPVPGTDGGS